MGTSHIGPMHPLGSLEGRFQGTLGPVRYGPWPHDPICLRACRSPTGQNKQIERGRPWDRELPTPRFLEQIFKSTGLEETRFRSYILARP